MDNSRTREFSLSHFTNVFVVPDGLEEMVPALRGGTPLRGDRVVWEEDAEGKLLRVAVHFVPA
jgi:hypothetical protein